MPIAGNRRPADFADAAAAISAAPRATGPRAAQARPRCRCRRWNGTPRSSATPRISTSGCKTVVPAVEWPFFAPYVKAINELKKRAQRGDPGAQLPDAGNLSLRRRLRRRQRCSLRARRPR